MALRWPVDPIAVVIDCLCILIILAVSYIDSLAFHIVFIYLVDRIEHHSSLCVLLFI